VEPPDFRKHQVMPIRGEVKVGNQNAQGWAYGIALPTGYLLFFKRTIQSDC
jgi:sensor c-di-GMP phosphodiesterase-like protein